MLLKLHFFPLFGVSYDLQFMLMEAFVWTFCKISGAQSMM